MHSINVQVKVTFNLITTRRLPMYLNRISIRPSNCLRRHVYWHPTLSRVWRSLGHRIRIVLGFGPFWTIFLPLSLLLLFSFCNAVSLSITPLALSARCKLFAAECKSSPRSATANIALLPRGYHNIAWSALPFFVFVKKSFYDKNRDIIETSVWKCSAPSDVLKFGAAQLSISLGSFLKYARRPKRPFPCENKAKFKEISRSLGRFGLKSTSWELPKQNVYWRVCRHSCMEMHSN